MKWLKFLFPNNDGSNFFKYGKLGWPSLKCWTIISWSLEFVKDEITLQLAFWVCPFEALLPKIYKPSRSQAQPIIFPISISWNSQWLGKNLVTVQIFSDFAYREQVPRKLGNMKNKEQSKAIRNNDTPFTSHRWVRTINYFNFITLRTRLIRVKKSYITGHVIGWPGGDNPWVWLWKSIQGFGTYTFMGNETWSYSGCTRRITCEEFLK